MPDLKLLKELLDQITEGNIAVLKDVERCKELLEKISRSKDIIHIDVDYDGRQFKWRVMQPNLTAREWLPRGSREE